MSTLIGDCCCVRRVHAEWTQGMNSDYAGKDATRRLVDATASPLTAVFVR